MAARRVGPAKRGGLDPKAGFRKNLKNDSSSSVLATMLKQSRQSGQLNLSGKGYDEVPDAVWRINIDVPEESRTVSLDNSEDKWWEQVDLNKLILASNTLTHISENIQNLAALTVLDIHDNNISTLPEALGGLTAMQRLNLSHNKFEEVPVCVGRLENLSILLISHNELSVLGDHVGNLYRLEELDVSHNKLPVLPVTIGHLTRLFRFNLSNNKVSNLPPQMGDMDSLRMLDCTHNTLELIPEEIGRMHKLEQLYLRHNRLVHLPMLTQCKNLKELHVGNNNIVELGADHIHHLPAISVLDLRDNKISKLPDEIVQLEALERLDLTNNDISSLPYVMGNLQKLKSIVLEGNPLKSIRRDIIMRGTNEIKKYLRSRIEERGDDATCNGGSVVTSGVSSGQSGIIGSATDQLNQHDVQSSKSLSYSEKKAVEIPEEVWVLASNSDVKNLNLSKNILNSWPERLHVAKGTLEDVNLGFNKILTIPASVSELAKLVHLDIRNNQISTVSDEINKCQNLREINLSYNRLKSLPLGIYGLPKLEIVIASSNQINTLDPDQLINTPQLATLDLENNDLMQIPPQLGNCTQLRSLKLFGNPCRNPRPAILTKGTPALLEYLRGRITT